MAKNILIVDDSESIRELVGMTLETAGYHVSKGSDGRNALLLLDGRDIDLIITDLNMPNMDGIEYLKEVRKSENYSSTPVLVLTTESQQSKKDEAKASGATGWIVKPFSPEKLLEIVKKVIR
ncbi:MAG: response regulator [Bacteroidia bacterium]|jgi:two-component system chemotaxis response regulator CheY